MSQVELRSQKSAQHDFAGLEASYSQIVGEQKRQLKLQAKHTPLASDNTARQQIKVHITRFLRNAWKHRDVYKRQI